MSINEIPVRVVGPGSQPDAGEDLRYLDMPQDMATFSAPLIPEPEDVSHLAGARETMRWLGGALARHESAADPLLANLTGLSPDDRDLVNQVLGEGEVSVVRGGETQARCQESVLAGVWRTLYFDDEGRVICDLLEVAATPHLLTAPCDNVVEIDASPPEHADEVQNALPILIELQAHAASATGNGRQHAINLSLLPLSEADIDFLDTRLGRGPIEILSRGYGKCEVLSTRTPGVWWVRYYNSMGTMILNSLEVTAVPEVVTAADEDLRDSGDRLRQILASYWQDDT
jgi:hydrogenase-1 operon protein HyaF